MSDDFKVSLRIGAMLDNRSVDATLGDFRRKSEKAAQEASSAFARAERSRNAIVRASDRERVQSERATEREIAAIMRQQVSDARRAQQDIRREHEKTCREAARLKRQELADERRVTAAAARDIERIRNAADRERESSARRTSYRATRFLFPSPEGAIGYARRVGHDVMRGLGMDWSLAAGLQRSRENEALATRISNQGYVPGEHGTFEQRISAAEIRKNSQTVGNRYAMSEADVSAGTLEYINLTGDLKGALPLMDKLALLSRATGTELHDAAKAAADMSVQFEGLPDKAERVQQMLGIAALQGKTGALELFQLAGQMPRIVSLAGQFAGDRSVAMANLLAGTQIARRYGGAGSPQQAATVMGGVVAAIQKGDKKFEKAIGKGGTRDAQGNLLSLPQIVAKSIDASTKGGKFNADMFFGMWNAIRGGKLAIGAKTLYDRAGGGEAGKAAVIAEFEKFTKGLDPKVLEQLAGAAVGTREARAQRFQTALDAVADKLMTNLAGPLETLEPKIKDLVEAFATATEFTANHLGSALMLAVGGSIARAGLESGFRTIVDRFMGAAGGAVSVSQGFGTLGGALKNTTLSLGAMAIAFGVVTAALDLLDESLRKKAIAEAASLEELDTSYQVGLNSINADKSLTPDQREAKKAELAKRAMKRLEWIEDQQGYADWLPDFAQDPNHQKNKGIELEMRKQYARDQVTNAGILRGEQGLDAAQLARTLQDGILQVRVVNPADMRPRQEGSGNGPPTADRGNTGHP